MRTGTYNGAYGRRSSTQENFMHERDEDLNAGQLSADRRSGCNRRSATDTRSKGGKGSHRERRSSESDRRSGSDRRTKPRYEFDVD